MFSEIQDGIHSLSRARFLSHEHDLNEAFHLNDVTAVLPGDGPLLFLFLRILQHQLDDPGHLQLCRIFLTSLRVTVVTGVQY